MFKKKNQYCYGIHDGILNNKGLNNLIPRQHAQNTRDHGKTHTNFTVGIG